MMFNSTIIEVAIGLVLIYLVLGLICTSINEYIAQLLALRAENLSEAIYGMFDGPDRYRIAEDIYDHPLVRSLSRKQFGVGVLDGFKVGEIEKYPSSIPPDIFSAVLIDLLQQNESAAAEDKYDPDTLYALGTYIRAASKQLEREKSIAAAAKTEPPADDKFERAKASIENWYGQALQRASGWYKRKAQVMSFMVAIGLVLVINGDTLMIVDRLSNSPVERAKLAALASQAKQNGTDIVVPDELKDTTMSFMGWEGPNSSDPRHLPKDFDGWLIKILGLAITAFAASLGAPFWFDVLSKFMTVRTGGDPAKKPDTTASATATAEVKP